MIRRLWRKAFHAEKSVRVHTPPPREQASTPPPAPARPKVRVTVTDGYLQDTGIFDSVEAVVERDTDRNLPLGPGESRAVGTLDDDAVVEQRVLLKSGLTLHQKDGGLQVSWPGEGAENGYFVDGGRLELPKQSNNLADADDASRSAGIATWQLADKGGLIVKAPGGDRQAILADGSSVYFDHDNRVYADTDGFGYQNHSNHIITTPDGKVSAIDYDFVQTGPVEYPPDGLIFARPVTPGRAMRHEQEARVTRSGLLQTTFDGKAVEFRPLVPLDRLS